MAKRLSHRAAMERGYTEKLIGEPFGHARLCPIEPPPDAGLAFGKCETGLILQYCQRLTGSEKEKFIMTHRN